MRLDGGAQSPIGCSGYFTAYLVPGAEYEADSRFPSFANKSNNKLCQFFEVESHFLHMFHLSSWIYQRPMALL